MSSLDIEIRGKVERRQCRIVWACGAAMKRKIFLGDNSPPVQRAIKRFLDWFGLKDVELSKRWSIQ